MGGPDQFSLSGWALILGASSGFGEACARELAGRGMNIVGVHLDRKSTLPQVEGIVADIRAMGRTAMFFNVNAADAEKRTAVVAEVEKALSGTGPLRLFLHSLAFGTLKSLAHPDPKEAVTQAQLEMTMDVMANSFVYWVQDLVVRKLLGRGSRVLGMTSAGSVRVWPQYGVVSAAKSALESYVRQFALELGPLGITANAIRAGVTDTPALRKIPGHEKMRDLVKGKNPNGRLTVPQDVAGAVALLCREESQWISGNIIAVDGGELVVD